MGLATTLETLADYLDPRLCYWSAMIEAGLSRQNKTLFREVSEHQLVRDGLIGLRKLDWALDLTSTGDIYRMRELRLHCPDGRTAILEITGDLIPFQFKTKALDMLGASGIGMEFQCIGRVLDKATGQAECFVWDYRPEVGKPHLFKWHTNIYHFGGWRANLTPLGALGVEVQGWRLG